MEHDSFPAGKQDFGNSQGIAEKKTMQLETS